MKKRNKKFKIEKSPKRKATSPRPKTKFKRRFLGFWEKKKPRGRRQGLEDESGRLESRFSSPLAIFLSLGCNGYHG